MHQIYQLQSSAQQAYRNLDFPKGSRMNNLMPDFLRDRVLVVSAVVNFSNVTLSSLYFDVTKDSLYADPQVSPERRAVLTVFEKVAHCLAHVRHS
jgi:isoleucyl-tRNA synthetase